MWTNIAKLISLLFIWTTTFALECNICGPGTQNRMAEQLGIVTLIYEGTEYKQNCEKWQSSLLLSEEWCEENILEYTYDICKCVLPDGSLLKDSIAFPTASPAPTFSDPLDDGSTVGNVQPVSLPTPERPGGPSSSRGLESVILGVVASVVVVVMAAC